jgi:DNA-binding CsgD family transcriptional regulator
MSPRRDPPPSERTRLTQFTLGGERFVVFSAPVAPQEMEALTASEREVLAQVARGMSNADIARARGTSTHTVANQIASLFRKTGAHSRADLARWASGRKGPDEPE